MEQNWNNGNILGPIFHFVGENIVPSLSVAVFWSILLQVTSDHIRKSYFIGVMEMVQLPPYYWSNPKENRIDTNTNIIQSKWWYSLTDSFTTYDLGVFTLV